MAEAGAALSDRENTSAFIGTWLFVISDGIGLVALVATMLALGGGSLEEAGLAGTLWPVSATLLLVGLSLSLSLGRRVLGPLAERLSLAFCLAFALVQLVLLRVFWVEGFASLPPAGERVMVLLLFHWLHVAAGIVLLARACVRRPETLGALAVYLHYLAVMWLVIFGFFYLL